MKYNWVPVLILIFLKEVHSQGLLEDECPDAEDIEPCTCIEKVGYFSRTITCRNVSNGDALRRAFQNAEGYYYEEVIIEDSMLQYIPHEIIEKTTASSVILRDTILDQIFDSPPQGVHTITEVMLDNITVSRNISWRLFNGLTHIDDFQVTRTSVQILGPSFSQYMSPAMRRVFFSGDKIKKIEPGALSQLENLKAVFFTNTGIRNLTRDIFPQPCNIKTLYLRGNKIDSIAEDMFTDMPNLEWLYLDNNFLSVLPESAFQRSVVKYLYITENPLKCNCQMRWLLKKDLVKDYYGTCASPKRLKWKPLEDLTEDDFHCRVNL